MLTEVVALEEMTAARLKEQGEWNATLAERQQVRGSRFLFVFFFSQERDA